MTRSYMDSENNQFHSQSSSLKSRLLVRCFVGFIVGVISILPLLTTTFLKSPYYISSEFIAYRFGDSMKLRFGDKSSVRPVQGVPTALLSRMVLGTNPEIGSNRGISRNDLDRYARLFGLTVATMVIVLSIFAWAFISMSAAAAFSLFLLAPWYLGVASMALFLSPEYWLGEWMWLAATLIIFGWQRSNIEAQRMRSPSIIFLLGMWMAIGATIKISLLGVAPIILLCALDYRRLDRFFLGILLFGAGLLLAYPSVLMVYLGSIRQGLALLKFQFQFFRVPNHSAEYADWQMALRHDPEVYLVMAVALLASYTLLIFSTIKRVSFRLTVGVILAVHIWFVLYLVMLARRPHDSTLTSISLSAYFCVSLMILLFPSHIRRIALATIVAAFLAIALIEKFPAQRKLSSILHSDVGDVEAADRFTMEAGEAKCAIWFMPDNSWNAVLIPQLVGYNGGLALYPVEYSSRHLYFKGGEVFQKLWPNTFIMGASPGEIDKIRLAALEGATIFYTRPRNNSDPSAPSSYIALIAALKRAGYRIVETQVSYDYRNWLFGHSEKIQ